MNSYDKSKESKTTFMYLKGWYLASNPLGKLRRYCGENLWDITLAYLAIGFLTPVHFSAELCVIYSVLVFLGSKISFKMLSNVLTTDMASIPLIAVLISQILIILFSPHGITTGLRFTLHLLDAFILFKINRVGEQHRGTNAFITVSSIAIFLMYLLFIFYRELFEVNGPLVKSGVGGSPVLFGSTDKNYTALFILFIGFISWKRKSLLGLFCALLFPLFYVGRQFLLMAMIIIAICTLLNYRRLCGITPWINRLYEWKRAALIFTFVAVGTVFILGLSSFWTTRVIGNNTSNYKASINDSSNAMRMIANQHAFQTICSEPSFFFYGYDSDIYNQLGISPVGGREQNIYIRGYRLVQPHEEVLNTLIKEGLLYSVSYYATVSFLLASVSKEKEDYALLAAVCMGSLLIAGMLRSEFLLLICISLRIRSQDFSNLWTALSKN